MLPLLTYPAAASEPTILDSQTGQSVLGTKKKAATKTKAALLSRASRKKTNKREKNEKDNEACQENVALGK